VLRDIAPVLLLIEEQCSARTPFQSSPRFRGEGDRTECGGGASSGAERPLHQPPAGPPPPENRGRISGEES
jgi:hypothetical protein